MNPKQHSSTKHLTASGLIGVISARSRLILSQRDTST